MIIVDTTVWVDYLRGTRTPHTDWLEVQLPRERLGLTDLILCEVLQGITTDKQFEAVQAELLKFAVFETGTVVRESGSGMSIDLLDSTAALMLRHP